MMLGGLTGFLGAAYPWVKAAHVTFVIFWMAGLFLVPRFYVYHHATTPGSAEDRAWIEREDRARTIILTPAMLLVWMLGLMLAVHLGAFGQAWFSAKLALVVALDRLSGLAWRLWPQARRGQAAAREPNAADHERGSRHRRGADRRPGHRSPVLIARAPLLDYWEAAPRSPA